MHDGDPNLYRYVHNMPVNKLDPTGLYMERGGGQEVSGTEGTQMIIDSYVRQNNGDYQAAWEEIVAHRGLGYFSGSDVVASAEHYLFAASEVECSVWNSIPLIFQIPGYQALKVITGTGENQTPPSTNQLIWGYQGVWDGM